MKSKSQTTYNQVFQHPITHNLEWRDLQAMFEDLGTVEHEHNGNLKVTLNDQAVVFHSPALSDIATTEQVMQVRHMLEAHGNKAVHAHPKHVLVIMNHTATTVYHLELGKEGKEELIPGDNLGHHKHVHSKHDYSDHIEKPNNHTYYEAITASLEGAEKILIFGSGTGSSNAMDLYVAWLLEHHPKLSDNVVDAMIVDESHLTEEQMLHKAGLFFKPLPIKNMKSSNMD